MNRRRSHDSSPAARRATGLLGAALLLGANPLAPAATAQETFTLPPIIVSGGLAPIAGEAYGRAGSVLTAAQIEARGLATVQDALRALPGVSVSSAGTSNTQVRIRGAEANHTLILIDGVEAAGGDGEYFLSGLETANIERIEVLRGPQSVFFGSNASAGVVNIVTRAGAARSEGAGLRAGGAVEAGRGWAASGFASVRGAQGGLALGLAARDDEGFDASGSGGEKDGTDRRTLTLSGDWAASEALTFGFALRLAEEDYAFDSTDFTAATAEDYVVDTPGQTSTREERSGEIFVELGAPGTRIAHRLGYELTEFDQSFNGFPSIDTRTEAVRYRLSYALDAAPVAEARQLLIFLAEREEDASRADPDYARSSTSVALEYRGNFDTGLDVQAGVRFDDNEEFEDATTWALGLQYTLPASGIRLHASAGTGVVNPSYFELFADAFGYVGNPGLEPERNRSIDLGAEFPFAAGRGAVDVTLFAEVLEREIVEASDGAGGFTFVNERGESRRNGLEVTARLQASEALSLRAGYTYLAAENSDGSKEIRRPEHEFSLGATMAAFGGRGSVSADLRHVAGLTDNAFFGDFATGVELDPFTSAGLAASYDLRPGLQLYGRVENLFDAEYSEVLGYVAPGRTIYAGLRASF